MNPHHNRLFLSVIVILSALGYGLIAYVIPRENFHYLITVVALLFTFYFLFYKKANQENTLMLIGVSLLFRAIFLFGFPTLSDDIYRFIWDGRLLANGFNPYDYLPTKALTLNIDGVNVELFNQLNSQYYYTVYPPFIQYIYGLTAFLFPTDLFKTVALVKGLIICSEMGTILLLKSMLSQFNLPTKNVILYALNPLVIIELSGNMHPEVFSIFFLVLGIWLITKGKIYTSTVAIAGAIGSKLLPLLIVPFLVKRLGWKVIVKYCIFILLTSLALALPFMSSGFISNFASSLDLYFRKFEFNASIYYVARALGIYIKGYNLISIIGPVLGLTGIIGIFLLAKVDKKPNWELLPVLLLLAFTIYFICSTVVHPWYLTTLVALSCLSTYRYSIIWSGLIMLSYSAYQWEKYTENMMLIALEYTAVFIFFSWEMRKKSNPATPSYR